MKKILTFLKERVFAIENNEKLKFRNLILYGIFLSVIFLFFLWLSFFLVIRSTKEYQLDNFHEMDLMKALILLQNKNLKVRIVKKVSTKYSKYTIMEQKPSSGTMVKKNRVITLTVSSGNLIFKIPKLIGKKPLQAKKQLLKIYKKKESTPSVIIVKEYSKFPKGKIFKQRPSANKKVDVNEGIFLFVSKGREKKELTIPNYINSDFFIVKNKLEDIGINVKLFFQQSSKKSGRILKQSITANETLDLSKNQEIEFLVAVKKKEEENLQSRLRIYSFQWKSDIKPDVKKIVIKIKDKVNQRIIFSDYKITGNPFEVSYLAYGKGALEVILNNKIYDKVFF